MTYQTLECRQYYAGTSGAEEPYRSKSTDGTMKLFQADGSLCGIHRPDKTLENYVTLQQVDVKISSASPGGHMKEIFEYDPVAQAPVLRQRECMSKKRFYC